jgi:hypothetical protein
LPRVEAKVESESEAHIYALLMAVYIAAPLPANDIRVALASSAARAARPCVRSDTTTTTTAAMRAARAASCASRVGRNGSATTTAAVAA